MKKHLLLAVIGLALVGGCKGKTPSSSVVSPTINNPSSSIIGPSTEIRPSTGGGSTTITDSSIPSPSPSTPIDTSNLKTISINEALELGKDLAEGMVGDLVKIEGTYLRTLTWGRSGNDIMILIDSTGQIGLNVPYAKYTGYLANRYTNANYDVIGNIAKNDNRIELVLNDTLSVQESFVSSKKEELFDPTTITTKIDSISSLIGEFEKLPLNQKKYGVGKIVTVEAQLVGVEYTNSNKKALFSDGQYCFTVVSDSGIATKTDIGKYYSVTGIMSVEVTSPALWYLSKSLVQSDNTVVEVSKATETRADAFKKYSILDDKYNNPSYLEYMTLYKTRGLITDDEGRTSKYYVGIIDDTNGTLNDVGGRAISGLLLLNHQGLDDRGFSYSPLLSYYENGEEIELYYSLNQYSSSDHGWKAFPIEALVS